jgi:hypothetical protein
VSGASTIDVGVQGSSPTGTGVLATSPDGTTHQVQGVATFSRSGRVMIAAGQSSVVVSQAALSASSLVLANLQEYLKGIYVEAVVPDASAGSFTIHLSMTVPAGDTANVGWFVVN